MARQKKDTIKVIIKPATDNADREGYAKINGKVLPYDVPVTISERDLKTLERIKEPRVVNRRQDPRAIMEQLRISQEKANKIARMSEKEGMGNTSMRMVNKYFVKVV